jgi:hypothetical protein
MASTLAELALDVEVRGERLWTTGFETGANAPSSTHGIATA